MDNKDAIKNFPHDSAIKHVTGASVYVNDMPMHDRLLAGRVVYSPHAHARIISFDITAAQKLKGVHAVLTYKDVPGKNQMGPIIHDEPCLSEGEVNCIGQAIFLIAAETEEIAIAAEKLINVEYEILEAVLEIEKAIERGNLIAPPRRIERGDTDSTMASAPNRIKGTLRTGPQEHWYLETQSALCVPGEGREMTVYASTQNPTETQAIVAEVLGLGKNDVVCEVRRLGGGFGGKETQGNHVSAWAALLAHATNRPVKIHLFRDDDQKITGKRHRYLSHYEVGFDNDGVIQSYIVDLNADAGHATDLSMSILERAMLHAENAYYLPNVRITGSAWRTNLPSNTAFRGFGGPQGIAVMETAIDRIGRQLNIDPLIIRTRNFYKHDTNNTTPYGQLVENNRIDVIYEKLSASSEYERRRKETDAFNAANKYTKKGLAFTPVKFGISFTTSFLNQAGALVNIYTDGTVLVNHGGVEMGQGLNTKMQQVAAAELGIPAEWVKVNATNTSKVPNSSPTAASSGSDLNGMAVKNAVDNIKSRLSDFVTARFNSQFEGEATLKENLVFANAEVIDSSHPERRISFKDMISNAYVGQVGLSSSGFYKTPGVNFDRAAGTGKPFHYFSYGMAVSEVILDTLTGSHRLLRTDIIHDAGSSLNEGLDIGQVEGAFVQGAGWVTTEEIKWDKLGNQLNHSPDTYKIPTIQDIPVDFRVELLHGFPNDNTIRRSKAVGEPPFMLAFSVWLAIKDAIAAVGDYSIEPEFGLPATNELILLAVEKIRKQLPVVR